MTPFRLSRLFHPGSGRCLDVAVDHSLSSERRSWPASRTSTPPSRPWSGPGRTPCSCPSGTHRCCRLVLPARDKPALVLRTDVANVYGTAPEGHLFSTHAPDAVEQAVRLDAACVVANLLQLPGRPEITGACVQSILRLRANCARNGMPLMVEPLVMRAGAQAGGYLVDGDTTGSSRWCDRRRARCRRDQGGPDRRRRRLPPRDRGVRLMPCWSVVVAGLPTRSCWRARPQTSSRARLAWSTGATSSSTSGPRDHPRAAGVPPGRRRGAGARRAGAPSAGP